MSLRETIRAEIERVDERHLNELYEVVRQFVRAKARNGQSELLAWLTTIRIDGPRDFAANLDSYFP
jgi:hypothetical protein